jgi:streptomycin 6-kinase
MWRPAPETVSLLAERWSLNIGTPFVGLEVSAAWAAPVIRVDGTPAVLKLGMPHMEARDELAGLRYWDGDGTVRLIDADEELNAMLLERCEPGTHLRALPEPEQDEVIAGLLRRLWRRPDEHPFRPLAELTAHWAAETLADESRWPDPGLTREGLALFEELPRTATDHVLLATDLHAGNVLRSQREPWLAIDPKPFVGDPAYDATQHLFNCDERLQNDPHATIERFASLLEIDAERVRLWIFARAAAEPRDDWRPAELELARRLAPE